MTLLSDETIKLRAVEPADADAMFDIESDSEQWIENDMSAPFSRENLRYYAKHYNADPYLEGQVRLVIESCDTKQIIGLVDLYNISARNHTGFVGIYIKREHRKQGYALRTLALLKRYARELLNLRVLAAKVMDSNLASHNLFTKAGYSEVGVLPDWILEGNIEHAIHIYQLKLTP